MQDRAEKRTPQDPEIPQARRIRFYEFWGSIEERYTLVKYLCLATTFLCIMLSFVIYRVVNRPIEVMVVPGAAESGLYRPGEVPREYVVDFARSFTMTFANYTPATAKSAFEHVRMSMGTKLLSTYDMEIGRRLMEIERDSISQSFSPLRYKVARPDRKRFVVTFEGIRSVYVGELRSSEQEYFFTVTLKSIPVTERNVRGLEVVSLRQGPLKAETSAEVEGAS